jgi:hypothetical protein
MIINEIYENIFNIIKINLQSFGTKLCAVAIHG